MDKPHYPNKPIRNLKTLSETLRVHQKLLLSIADRADDSYHSFCIPGKPGKKSRDVYEPKIHLKRIQKRINKEIFESIKFPEYLKGSIKDEDCPRDYVRNAEVHGRAEVLIGLDITDFYGSIQSKDVQLLFKNFFKFSDDVAEVLTKLVTLNGSVPQGACSSSYLANLIFVNNEYRIVSKLRQKGIRYTRLLDDITISSENKISHSEITSAIDLVIGMFTKAGLKSNDRKKFVITRNFRHKKFDVTGVWVGNRLPKLRKSERNYIRQLVFVCEKAFLNDPTNLEYHKLWNKTSGLVAKMSRLKHSQAKKYREKLKVILPVYSEEEQEKLVYSVKKLVKKAASLRKRGTFKIGMTRNFNLLQYRVGILSRTDESLASSLRQQLDDIRDVIPTKQEFWNGG